MPPKKEKPQDQRCPWALRALKVLGIVGERPVAVIKIWYTA